MVVKKVFAMVMVLVCVSGMAFCESKNEVKADAFKETSVLVEAFIVRVSTQGLIKSGVNQISNAPDGISILNILWCLATEDHAKVISGAKLTASHNQEASLTRYENKYIKRTSASSVSAGGRKLVNPVVSTAVCYDNYKVGNEFTIHPYVKSDETIKIEAVYEETGIDENQDSGAPLNQITIKWAGDINVKSGIPAIAAAVQEDEESISFLILTATIQNKPCKKTVRKSDIDRMQGIWKGTELGGRGGEWTLVFNGNQVQVDGPDPEDYTGTMVTDETTTPKSAQFTVTKFAHKEYVGKIGNNIYKLEGDKLILAGNEPGRSAKPTSFKPGNGTRVFEFKKIKLK